MIAIPMIKCLEGKGGQGLSSRDMKAVEDSIDAGHLELYLTVEGNRPSGESTVSIGQGAVFVEDQILEKIELDTNIRRASSGGCGCWLVGRLIGLRVDGDIVRHLGSDQWVFERDILSCPMFSKGSSVLTTALRVVGRDEDNMANTQRWEGSHGIEGLLNR